MHVAICWNAVTRNARVSLGAAILCCAVATLPAHAAPAAPVDGMDGHLLADLEQRASLANPREQAYLYADLADRMTLLASRQLAEGEIEKAEATLEKLELYTARMESNFRQSKSLKKTELLLHLTNRRLTDMTRAASYDVKPHVQQALTRLNLAQTSLLAILFEK